MKYYCLERISDPRKLVSALDELLPSQQHPWIITSDRGDAVAYFNIDQEDENTFVQADMSGRHFNRDADVIAVLRSLRDIVGGEILDDNDEIVPD